MRFESLRKWAAGGLLLTLLLACSKEHRPLTVKGDSPSEKELVDPPQPISQPTPTSQPTPLPFDTTPPQLVSPANDTSNLRPTFIWNAVQGATRYEIVVWLNGTTVHQPRDITTTSWTPLVDFTGLGAVQWWVRANPEIGLPGAWSEGVGFDVVAQ